MTAHYLLTEYGEDDYGLWITDDITNEATGSSVRGSIAEIKKELDEALVTKSKASKKTASYELGGHTYTIENLTSERWQMTVWDEKDHDSYGISDPSLIIKVLTLGTPVERS